MASLLLGVAAGPGAPAQTGGPLAGLDRLLDETVTAQPELLPAEQAFRLDHAQQGETLRLMFDIATGYYVYRDKIKVEAITPGIAAGPIEAPAGEQKDDPEFGVVQVYRGAREVAVPISGLAGTAAARVKVAFWGCAEDRVCYPPIHREIALTPPAPGAAPPPPNTPAADFALGPGTSLTDRMAADLGRRTLGGVVLWFFLAGLALALTPCVFPMIPILSGIIVGQRQPLSAIRSFALAAVYVVAMAATYAAVGLAAGLLGRNLQGLFQHPAAIVGFSAVFVALALSMFGFFHLQLPSTLQNHVEARSRAQAGGSLVGVAIMGVLSAVIVGPCVAPPLAAALLYLGHQGSPLVGGLALFAMGLGMGAPLLAIGASAGRLLPRAGAWMETVKQAFGVVFLGLAIWFLERLVPPPATLALWALLLIGSAIFLGALEPLHDAASGWQRLWKSMGLALLSYGIVLIVGAAAGADNPLKPLAPLAAGGRAHAEEPLAAFVPVKGTAQLELAVAAASAQGKPVLLDLYADWCIECKRLDRNTFADPAVQRMLAGFVLLRADLTDSDVADNALLARLELVGPPAVLLFNAQGTELRAHRLVGYAGPQDFGARLASAYGP
jgi:thiol:disulfide interchange protein DsbD